MSITKWIDLRSGLWGALIMGGIVLLINLSHGFWAALPAASKQAGYTFLLGGLLVKGLKTMTLRFNPPSRGAWVSTLVFSILTISLVYAVHSLKGTPETLMSTLPTVLLAPPGFYYLAHRTARKKR